MMATREAGAKLPHRPRNRLLAAVSPRDWELIRPHLERVPLRRRQILMDRHVPVQHVYFVEHGAVVLAARTEADGFVGVGLVDGGALVGIPVVLGIGGSAIRAVVEVPGEAHRIAADHLREAMQTSPSLRHLLLGYVYSVLNQRSQSVLCVKRHPIEQRLARWLLTTRDELGEDRIRVTHLVLSHDLGVRRASVSTAIGEMAATGAIRPGWACIEITDREELERLSCECYRIIKATYLRIEHAASTGADPVP